MFHQCEQQTSSAYPCSCGVLYGGCGGCAASFSILFPVSEKQSMDEVFDSSYSSASSSVDCTLSLGTPSTRQSEHKASAAQIQRPSCVSSMCWDIISGNAKKSSSTSLGSVTAVSGGAGSSLGGDPLLLARRCANCDTTSTPLWRNGPRGPKSLCNACGIRYKKEERRAAASTASAASSASAGEQLSGYGYYRQQQSPWSCYASSGMNSSSISTYDDMVDDGDAAYLSWRLNVMPAQHYPVRDRPSLFQYN